MNPLVHFVLMFHSICFLNVWACPQRGPSLLRWYAGTRRFMTEITLPTKVHLIKAMVFPVVMYGCESWTVKKAECRRIDAFELWCWRRLLWVPWTARRSNQSLLKETGSECSLEGLMLRLKLQYFGHLMRRVDSLEKTLMLGGIRGRRNKGMTEDEMAEWHHWLDAHEFGWTPGVGDGQGDLACWDSRGPKESDTTERLNWTELNQSMRRLSMSWSCTLQPSCLMLSLKLFPEIWTQRSLGLSSMSCPGSSPHFYIQLLPIWHHATVGY